MVRSDGSEQQRAVRDVASSKTHEQSQPRPDGRRGSSPRRCGCCGRGSGPRGGGARGLPGRRDLVRAANRRSPGRGQGDPDSGSQANRPARREPHPGRASPLAAAHLGRAARPSRPPHGRLRDVSTGGAAGVGGLGRGGKRRDRLPPGRPLAGGLGLRPGALPAPVPLHPSEQAADGRAQREPGSGLAGR